ncbi:MAG: MraY family glycosyltransferase [Candidatus Sumerlaeaceae bacterium]
MLSLGHTQLVLLASFATALVATWLIRGAMRRSGILDTPDESRKTHRAPVAYEGGVAMWLACVAGIVVAALLVPAFVFELRLLQGMIVGATLIVAVGVADDLLDLGPVTKLLAQLGVGLVMHYFGFRIERFSNPFGEELHVLPQVSYAMTALWYALLMNGINMIDGMDGLAAGIVAISSLTLAAVAFDLGQPLAVILALILAASCLGFLPFNFIPATIFMGDAGSLLLGFMLASITLLSSSKAPAVLALIIPMLAVALPLFETVFAFVRRASKGQHPFRADRRHLHHRFLALGFSERRTLFTFYYITAYFGVTAYVLQRLEAKATLALVAIIGIGMFVLIENMRFLESRTKQDPAQP